MFVDDTDPETSESSTEEAVEEEPDVEDEPVEEPDEEPAAKKGEGPPEGSKRWNKVYAGYKQAQQYGELGTPQEIANELHRLRSIEATVAKLDDKGKGDTKESDELKKQHAEIRSKMHDVIPGLKKLDSISDAQDLYTESLRARAADAVVEQMEEAGQEVSRESHAALAGVLDSIISNDRRLYLTYVTSPERAVKLAYEKFAAPLQVDAERKQKASLLKGKEGLKKLPKTQRQTSGDGSPSVKKAEEPKDIRAAEQLFAEQLKQLDKE